MSIYLKDREVDRLARELAAASFTETVRRALRERHARLLPARENRRRRVEQRLARIAALPLRDSGDLDAALYDTQGLPKA